MSWIEPGGGLGLTTMSGASVAAFAVFGGSVVLVAEVMRSALKDLAKSEERASLLAAEMKQERFRDCICHFPSDIEERGLRRGVP